MLKRSVLPPSRLQSYSVTSLLPVADENLRRTGENMSTHESGSAQVLAAPEAAWIAMPASVHLRRPTSDDIAGTTGGSLSRPRASVTCAGRTTTRRAALLRASAGCMHWAGWARKSHLKTRFLARTAPRGARWLDDILGAQCDFIILIMFTIVKNLPLGKGFADGRCRRLSGLLRRRGSSSSGV